MSNYSLSILIPARNEQFLKNTVEDILKNKRGKTEIIVGLDGEWSDPGLPQHPDVQVLKVPDPIGQRAMVNQLCRLSKAKYVMKLDAHCAVDEGFDVKMMAEMKEDYTMVPKMYNLHVFDWVCTKCGNRRYQGKKGKCEKCGGEEIKDMVWKPRWSRENTAMRFDKNMRFAYWGAYKKYQQGDVVETMSILGACFMLTREGFWELEICDEDHGSWGQQGTEVACKTWLSGRKLMCNKKTWFAHLFRTQGDDFGFPYDNPGTEIEKARAYSKDLWLNDRWPKAKYKLSWLINKFNPPEWNETKGIVYYTDSQLDQKIETAVQEQLRGAAQGKRIISVSLKPSSFGENKPLPLERGPLTMFKQILAGLEALDTDIVFLCEHDVLYHPSHFDFIPPERNIYYYNTNVWKYRLSDGLSYRVDDCRQTSGLVAYRDLLIKHYKKRIALVEEKGFSRKMGYEPGTHNREERVDDFKSERFESTYPNIDIRHDRNLTASRWSKDEFRNQEYTKGWRETKEIPGWPSIVDMFK